MIKKDYDNKGEQSIIKFSTFIYIYIYMVRDVCFTCYNRAAQHAHWLHNENCEVKYV